MGQDDTGMIGMALAVVDEVSNIESQDAASTCARRQKLRFITRVERHPLVWGSGDIVSACNQRRLERFLRDVGIPGAVGA